MGQRDANIAGLDCLCFQTGDGPESIKHSFPLLTLEEIYGSITFYLANEQEIDSYLEEAESQFEAQAREMNSRAKAASPELFERIKKKPDNNANRATDEAPVPG